ncbi:hypothetical protein F2P79_004934 [Pimephales promelas]|nr:hypothetical protein F2P79_004934 [Pimephales promelas]
MGHPSVVCQLAPTVHGGLVCSLACSDGVCGVAVGSVSDGEPRRYATLNTILPPDSGFMRVSRPKPLWLLPSALDVVCDERVVMEQVLLHPRDPDETPQTLAV